MQHEATIVRELLCISNCKCYNLTRENLLKSSQLTCLTFICIYCDHYRIKVMALKIKVPTNLKGKLWELKESISQPDGFLSTSIENYSVEIYLLQTYSATSYTPANQKTSPFHVCTIRPTHLRLRKLIHVNLKWQPSKCVCMLEGFYQI